MKTSQVAIAAVLAGSLVAVPVAAQVPTGQMGPLRPDQEHFLDLYTELVDTNTTLSAGSCTQAAQQLADRLVAAGMPADSVTVFSVPDHPREGGLVALYQGTSDTLEPMLLLGHIDTVEADPADWERDPFTMVEDSGYYYARGVYDDKAMSAIWADTLVRFADNDYRPGRTVKLALTCGEETDTAFNGANYLAQNERELIDAAFALNEGGGGRTDGEGNLVVQTIQVGEKIYQDYRLVATNPGGHSSQPVPDNALYQMSAALLAIGAHEFPLEFTDVTRTYFELAGAQRDDELGAAMRALAANPEDGAAEAIVNADRALHSMLRTTCVATMIDGGHAVNALPQRVEANVNCRIFPGHDPVDIMAELATIIDNDDITITRARTDKPVAISPPLDPAIVGPMEQLSAEHFPGVPVIPAMSTGATDGLYLSAVGIPVYGVPGSWRDPDGNGTHGLNERIEVRSVMAGRDYLFDLVKALAE